MTVISEQIAHKTLVDGTQISLHSHAGGSGGNYGQATIPFDNWLPEDSISITGQTGLLDTSKIIASVYANNDDIYAQNWWHPIIRNVIAGIGFDITLRPEIGTFKGNVKVNWLWS